MHEAELNEGLVPCERQVPAVEEDEVHLCGDEEEASSRHRSLEGSRGQFGADLQAREDEATRAEADRPQPQTEASVLPAFTLAYFL